MTPVAPGCRRALHRNRRARSPRRQELCALFKQEAAKAVLDDINQLEAALTR